MYGLLLWASRNALRTGKSTHLSRATAFLSDDYIGSAFWWETIEMCRKLTLSTTAASRTVPFRARIRLSVVYNLQFDSGMGAANF